MKRIIAIMLFFGAASLFVTPTGFADEYEDGQANPFRILAYFMNPIGIGLEFAIARPLHALTDVNNVTRYIFGHTPHSDIFAEDPVDAIRRERAENLQEFQNRTDP